MGIKNLKKWLKDKYPELLQKEFISIFENKKIAVDISSYIYRYKSIYKEEWLLPFFNFLTSFRVSRVHAIFDGKAPKEKDNEILKRQTQKVKQVMKTLYGVNKIDILLNEKDIIPKDIFLNENDIMCTENIENNIVDISELLKESVGITKKDKENVKQMLEILKIPYFKAEGEAEALACYLYKMRKVSGILSMDTDVLVYGCENYICDYEPTKNVCTMIRLSLLLEKLKMTYENFVDFCIMCKCDYNESIPSLGSVTIYKLFKKYKSLKKIQEMNPQYDYGQLKLEKCREIFFTYGNLIYKDFKINYWEPKIDYIELVNWFREKLIKVDKNDILLKWKPTTIVLDKN